MISCVVGLGNPGSAYAGTRHNLGRDVVAAYAAHTGARWGWRFWRPYWQARTPQGTMLIQPATYMNHSGDAVAAVRAKTGCPPENFLIVYDDVHLPVGRLRLRRSGSDGGHNGLASVIHALGTDAVPRLRIGIDDNPHDRTAHVLGRFTPQEQPVIDAAVREAIALISRLCTQSWKTAVCPAHTHTNK